jgi:hypothetical protein
MPADALPTRSAAVAAARWRMNLKIEPFIDKRASA